MSNFDVETSHCSSRNWCNYERLITILSSKLLVGPSLTMSDFQLLSQMMLKNTLNSDFFYNQKLRIFNIRCCKQDKFDGCVLYMKDKYAELVRY